MGRRLNAFRRSLCEAVEAASSDGTISLTAAASIDSAAHWQRHLLLAARWLREQHDAMKPDQRLAFSREVAKAAESRDRAIRLLGLERSPGDDIETLFAELRSGAIDASAGPPITPGGEPAGQITAGDQFRAGFGSKVDGPGNGSTATTPMQDRGQAPC